jgi:transposase
MLEIAGSLNSKPLPPNPGRTKDQAAVVAALALPDSQGQTEGFLTKLKLVKRSMYRRANFDLLRAYIPYADC